MSTVILFGNPRDPEMRNSINRIAIGGRKVEIAARPSFDTGLGKCGTHLCHCKVHCAKKFDEANQPFTGAYPGDKAPTMGQSF